MSDILPWSKTTFLKWSDFEADPNPAVFEDASVMTRYRVVWTVGSEKIKDQIQFFIEDIKMVTEFYPALSWVRDMYATDKLLRHAQGHFDLVESLREKITANISKAFHGKMYPAVGKNKEQRKQFAREYSALLLEDELKNWQPYVDKRQSEYDTHTDFGGNAKAQSDYDVQFAKLRQ